jgi:hypothetical protein
MMLLDLFGPDLRLFSELPEIRRAREYHLYDAAGRRYLDLYQDCGRAVLGHRPDGLSKAVQNTLSRGIAGDFPTSNERRLAGALVRLLPHAGSFRIYRSTFRAAAVFSALGIAELTDPLMGRSAPLAGPASGALETGTRSRGAGADAAVNVAPGAAGTVSAAAVWRPFSDLPYDRYPALVPVLPFPGSWGPVVAAFRRGLEAPPSDPVSPVYLAGLARAAWNLVNAGTGTPVPSGPAKPSSASAAGRGAGPKPNLRDAASGGSLLTETVLQDLWIRNGIYLVPGYRESDHEKIFRFFLSKGFLLPPSAALPAVLPGAWSRSEEKTFAEACVELKVRGSDDGT